MTFRYKEYGSGILRPVIPIVLVSNFRSVGYEVLVDSGADICIFDAQIGDLLGLDVEAGQSYRISGVTGVTEKYYLHPVTMIVGGQPQTVDVGFLRSIGRYGYGIVGQRGFSDRFVVAFDYEKGVIELTSRGRN